MLLSVSEEVFSAYSEIFSLFSEVFSVLPKEVSSEAESESATEAVSEAGESEESGEVSYPLTLTGTDGTEITINEEPEKIVSMGPNMTEKYIGSDEIWEESENAIREACKEKGLETREEIGEAAFYGPKLVSQ